MNYHIGDSVAEDTPTWRGLAQDLRTLAAFTERLSYITDRGTEIVPEAAVKEWVWGAKVARKSLDDCIRAATVKIRQTRARPRGIGAIIGLMSQIPF